LKPKVAYTEMNLAVTTNKRRYYFEYSASARRPNPDIAPVMYAVRFSYPPPHPGGDGLTDEQRVQLELARAAEPPAKHRLLVLWGQSGEADRGFR
jgi:type IV secretory pathway VirB9-like protein